MNFRRIAGPALLGLALLLPGQGRAADEVTKPVDAKSELRSQDRAFSLLVATYREFKLAQIRAAHEEGVKARAALSDPNVRREAAEAHTKQCDERLAKLRTELANFDKAYSYARPLNREPTGTEAPVAAAVEKLTVAGQAFAELAEELARRGDGFDQIFKALCERALADANASPQEQARALFNGLWIWARQKRGHPVLQQRADWALHFIAGGMFEGDASLGHSGGVAKERLDTGDPNNFFDLDDLAATMLGARWMDLATHDDSSEARRWIQLWATGQFSLQRSLPELRYGHLRPGKEASDATIDAIHRAMNDALTLPAKSR